MKERPILFSGAMVRSLLNCTKSQTRRVVKHEDIVEVVTRDEFISQSPYPLSKAPTPAIQYVRLSNSHVVGIYCPYGQPGDRLWVRESGWERPERTPKMMREGADTWPRFAYAADGWNEQDRADFKAWGFKPRPSIHMPRWASRINLEITGVRVEKLQDISEADAIAEGIDAALCEQFTTKAPGRHFLKPAALHAYAGLWEAINGAGSWDENPWVWAVEFKRVTA